MAAMQLHSPHALPQPTILLSELLDERPHRARRWQRARQTSGALCAAVVLLLVTVGLVSGLWTKNPVVLPREAPPEPMPPSNDTACAAVGDCCRVSPRFFSTALSRHPEILRNGYRFIGADAGGECLDVQLAAQELWRPTPFCAKANGNFPCPNNDIIFGTHKYGTVDIIGRRTVRISGPAGVWARNRTSQLQLPTVVARFKVLSLNEHHLTGGPSPVVGDPVVHIESVAFRGYNAYPGCFADETRETYGGWVPDATCGGGAIYVDGGSLSVVNVLFENMTSVYAGGAIFIVDGYIVIGASQFQGCRAEALGGSIFIEEGAIVLVLIKSSTFEGGSAGLAGAMVVAGNKEESMAVVIENVRIHECTSDCSIDVRCDDALCATNESIIALDFSMTCTVFVAGNKPNLTTTIGDVIRATQSLEERGAVLFPRRDDAWVGVGGLV